jgi:hypothetical protein
VFFFFFVYSPFWGRGGPRFFRRGAGLCFFWWGGGGGGGGAPRTYHESVCKLSRVSCRESTKYPIHTLTYTPHSANRKLPDDRSVQSPNFEFLNFMEPKNRFQGIDSASLCSPAGQDNPILTRFLAPIDCLQIPALDSLAAPLPGSIKKQEYSQIQ